MNENKNRKRLLNREDSVMPSEMGKLPPQAVELEEAVLGAMLLEREAVGIVIDILSAESFYKEQNSRVFNAVKTLFNRSEPIDILTVTQELKRTGELEIVGGAYYISALTNRIGSTANIEYHARIVAQKHLQREVIRTSTENIRTAYEESTDAFELLDSISEQVFSMLQVNVRKQYEKITQILVRTFEEIDAAAKHPGGVIGVPAGFPGLDRLTGGWQKSDLIVIAGRPGMGKTALVVSMALNACVEFKKPVALFSLEMSSIQLSKRMVSHQSDIPLDKILKGALTDQEYTDVNSRISALAASNLYLDDTPALTLFELRAKARRLKDQHKIELLIIDYLQLMSSGSDGRYGNREQEISTISRGLKALAKELDIPIIALSQLSRQVETRQDKEPLLSDLRESGAIEQDADQVMFIFRPEYYGMTEDKDGRDMTGQAKIIIAKNRHGALESVFLRFIGKYCKFADPGDVAGYHTNTETIPLTGNTNFLTDIKDIEEPWQNKI